MIEEFTKISFNTVVVGCYIVSKFSFQKRFPKMFPNSICRKVCGVG